jgi:aspartyl-tRNA(Asn)/glutamyl-tRNA(Gln) amidotransferase subunit B
MKFEAVIGIETHVQLKTKSKLFCGCDNDARDAAPNTKVCPVCMGFPGTLPVLNGQAVDYALRVGLALNAEIPEQTKFDRKNYFYPDLPKGYQITQFDQPIVGHGHIDVPLDGEVFRVGITRAHMEEDAGKLTHPAGAAYSLVDLNRAGTPLMEIVSEPDIRTPAQAKAYAQEIYNLMRYAEVSDADLYYGNMRFDINISLRPAGQSDFGVRAEIKNLNSFRAVERAALYEIERQSQILEAGDRVVQETRGWNEDKGQTFSQRSKEEAHDYRYFPEPDLPPVIVTKAMLARAQSGFPAARRPSQIRKVMLDHGLDSKSVEILVASPVLAGVYLEILKGKHSSHHRRIANWLIGDVARLINERTDIELNPSHLEELAIMVDDNRLSSTGAKEVLREAVTSSQSPKQVAERLNLIQVSDESEILSIVKDVIGSNPKPVDDLRAGKPQALGFLVGQVMKASLGKANPKLVNELIVKELKLKK